MVYYKDSPLGSWAPHPPLGYPVPGERRPQARLRLSRHLRAQVNPGCLPLTPSCLSPSKA